MTSVSSNHSPLLEVVDLHTHFRTDAGILKAVDGVSWSIRRGRTLAVVGESGCGKSVSALSIMRLIPDPPGRIAKGRFLLHDETSDAPSDLLAMSDREMRAVRGDRIAMVFQEPMSALNPVLTVGEQIAEAVRLHRAASRRDAWDRAVEMLQRVGIAAPEQRAREYAHQMSGGMRQRAMIAMALSCDPELLIADEPTTALDVTVQAQILDLLTDLQESTGMGLVLITHDLGVVARTADDVCVMYAGKIVEQATVTKLFDDPLHPYTRGLLRSVPRISDARRRLDVIPGSVPDPAAFPPGCRFHPRCTTAREAGAAVDRETTTVTADGESVDVLRRCVEGERAAADASPELREVRTGHFVACWEAEAYDRPSH